MTTPLTVQEPPQYPVELVARDLRAYRASNTGIDYVHSFDSGRAGLHVMVNALTHGNELCGMEVVRRLLDAGVRPSAGRLTLSFANVEAYARFGAGQIDARFVDRDFNRLWHDELLAADTCSSEARRAHQMRPLVCTVDRLLDLHSTWHALLPFFVVPALPRARILADRLGVPARQLLLPQFRHEGYHLIDHGRFAQADGDAIGLIAECGQHFAHSSALTAWQVAVRFLELTGCLSPDAVRALQPEPILAAPVERYAIVEPLMTRTGALRLTCSYAGFVAFAQGAVAAWDGDEPVRAPFDGAVVLAPRPNPGPGQQAFAWGRRLA